MLRRLRNGKKSSSASRSGHSGVAYDVQDVFVNPDHKQPHNDHSYTVSPRNKKSLVHSAQQQTKVVSPSKSPCQEDYRRRLDRLGQKHQSRQRRLDKEIQPAVDSPDDVSKVFTTSTHESPFTVTSNDDTGFDHVFSSSPFPATPTVAKSARDKTDDNSISFSTIWDDDNAYEPLCNTDSTSMRVAEARRTVLNMPSSSLERHSYKHNHSAQHRMTTQTEAKRRQTQSTATQQESIRISETRRHDHDYQPTPPRQRKAMKAVNSSKVNETIIKVKLSPEMEKKEKLPTESPPPSAVASSTQTPKLDNGTKHLITRLLKKHQYHAERKAMMEPLQQTDLTDSIKRRQPTSSSYTGMKNVATLQSRSKSTSTGARNQQTQSARKFPGLRPDPISKSSTAAARLERAPDPPAEEWKRPIPVKKVTSTNTKNTASSSNFWEEVQNFPDVKNESSLQDQELQQFFKDNLVKVTKEPIDSTSPQEKKPQTQRVARRNSQIPQDEGDNFSNAFSLNLAVNKYGNFDDSDISALEMFDSATVYHQDAMAATTGNEDAKNYWKAKYDRLKEQQAKLLFEQSKIVEESSEIDDEGKIDSKRKPKQRTARKEKDAIGGKKQNLRRDSHQQKADCHNDLHGMLSGNTGDLDESAAYPPLCRDGLPQTMDMLMNKVNKLESNGTMQIVDHIEENGCTTVAEQVIFPVVQSLQEQSEQQHQYGYDSPHNKSLADDLTAGGGDGNDSHDVELEAAYAQRQTPRSNEKVMEIAGSPSERRLHADHASRDEVTHPMICLGSLRVEATPSERVRQSLLLCSDSLMSRFPPNSGSNQLAIPDNIDPKRLILLCKQPHFIRETITQTIVHYGKKIMHKREVISELNHNILLFGMRHPLVGESHLKLGLLQMYEGQHADAILHLEEALKIKAAFLGADHPDFASILMFIALAQLALERLDDCLISLLGVRRIREGAIGHTHHEIGLILNNIACVQYELGDSKTAEALFQEALDLQREAFTTDPSFLKSVSTLLRNIAFLHAKNGLFPKALIELEGALQIQQEILCGESDESEATTANIAHIMAIQKLQHGAGNMDEITDQYITMLKQR